MNHEENELGDRASFVKLGGVVSIRVSIGIVYVQYNHVWLSCSASLRASAVRTRGRIGSKSNPAYDLRADSLESLTLTYTLFGNVNRRPRVNSSSFHGTRVNLKLASHQSQTFLHAPNTDSTMP
jgi:hypothetical protein